MKEAIAQQNINHDEHKHLYNECQAIEQVVRKHNIDATLAEYLGALCNADTDMINETTLVII